MENFRNQKMEIDSKEDIKKVSTVVFIVLLVVFALVMLTNSFHMNNETVNTYNYQVGKDLKYEVYLNRNKYIEQNPQGMNELYISNLVKNILLNMNYSYKGEEKGDLTYNYFIEARLIGEYESTEGNGKKRVWNKVTKLVLPQQKTIKNTDVIKLHHDVDIDFNKYRTEVRNFTKDLGLAINASLEVVMNISINGTTNSKQVISENNTVTAVIPLSQDVFSITTDTSGNGDVNVQKAVMQADINYVSLSLGLISLIFAIVLTIMLFKRFNKNKNISEYEIKVKKIMNEYGDIVIETNTPVDYSKYNVVGIKSFDELLDLEQELRIPIIVYIDLEIKKSVFSVIHNSTLYCYILEEESKEE